MDPSSESEPRQDADDRHRDRAFLDNLVIGIGELAEVTGVPTRQLRYWEDRGHIASLSSVGRNRRYDYSNVKRVILIKELLDEGYTLEVSVAKLEARLGRTDDALRRINR